jgi:GT2 family glycosyltransferase
MTDLTVSIVSYNVADELDACVASARAAAPRHQVEVIVVDNASADSTPEVLERIAALADVKVIANPENRGFAAANNQALRLASGRYFMLLNPDCEVRLDGLSLLIEALDADEGLGIVAPQLLDADGEVTASCRQFPDLEAMFWHLSYLDKLFPSAPRIGDYMMGRFDHLSDRDVDQPQGAALMFRRSVLESIGPLDERFFLYFEEVDWCLRVKRAGHRTRFIAGAQIMHRAGSSANQVWGRSIRFFFESMVRYYRKHYGPFGVAAVKTMVVGGAMLRMGAWHVMAADGRITSEERAKRVAAFRQILHDLPDY